LLKMHRYFDAKRLGGLEIEGQLDFDGKLDGKLTRFRACAPAATAKCRLPIGAASRCPP
jgi:hypothetical protein